VGLIFAKLILRLLSLLPAGGPYWLARRLAPLWMRLSPGKRNTTVRNLERCFPDLDADARDELVRESFVHYVAAVLEAGHNLYWSTDKLQARCDEVIGRDALNAALESGRGVMVLAPHWGAWEYLGIYLQRVPEIAILYKPPEDPRLDKALVGRRERGGATMIPASARGVRALFAHLKSGRGAGVLPDQEPSRGQGRFAPFFGVPALTGVLAPRIARKTGCRVFFGVCERLGGGRYRIHILPSEEVVSGDDLDAAVAAVNRGVERCVEIDPAQYLWSYRRFKTRPEGEPPFYG
jgi:KDO2-lipid IV(A) lauroyltransferase